MCPDNSSGPNALGQSELITVITIFTCRLNFYSHHQVPQPDGTVELEDRMREKARSVQPNVPPSINEVAELVVLNSHRLERIAITPPSGGDPVLITLYADSELSDNGEIGCDYLMENYQAQEEVKWRKIDGFDIKVDEQIGRELPLPSKKGTESAEITASTAMANLKDTAGVTSR